MARIFRTGHRKRDESVKGLLPILMTENLGYTRFGAQSEDWGARVAARLGFAYPDRLIGIHVTSVAGSTINL